MYSLLLLLLLLLFQDERRILPPPLGQSSPVRCCMSRTVSPSLKLVSRSGCPTSRQWRNTIHVSGELHTLLWQSGSIICWLSFSRCPSSGWVDSGGSKFTAVHLFLLYLLYVIHSLYVILTPTSSGEDNNTAIQFSSVFFCFVLFRFDNLPDLRSRRSRRSTHCSLFFILRRLMMSYE